MPSKLNLIGKKFNKLIVLEETPNRRNGAVVWKCLCECGNEALVTGSALKSGHTKSCGCLIMQILQKRITIHNKSGTFEHTSWRSMRSRCLNKANKRYEDYGGRGIVICDRWLEPNGAGFLNFLEDMGEAPEGYTLDRIDVDGNYTPENCRWADITTQNFNQRIRKNNTSGRTGVYWDHTRHKWYATICMYGKRTYLGRFDTIEEAIRVREKAELDYKGFVKK